MIAGQGEIELLPLIGLVWVCAVLGDSSSFLIGRRMGRRFLMKQGPRIGINEQRLEQRAVAAAWATAAPARSGNPDEHDDRLARARETSASHHSVPVLVPPTAVAGGFERARRLTASAGRRVIRLCPGGHRYPLVDWVLSPVPELCEREGVAVVLDFVCQKRPKILTSRPNLPITEDTELTVAARLWPSFLSSFGGHRPTGTQAAHGAKILLQSEPKVLDTHCPFRKIGCMPPSLPVRSDTVGIPRLTSSVVWISSRWFFAAAAAAISRGTS